MSLLQLLDMLANVAAILGIPAAIFLFVNEKQKERREREYGTYDALDDKYIAYLQLCMENPELDLYDLPLAQNVELSPQQKIRQYAMFEILLSIFERAFLMYRDQSNKTKQRQWSGWDAYIHDYGRRETFRRLWQLRGTEYDVDFIAYIDLVVATCQSETAGEERVSG
ncbi:MAG: hypothetical protein KC441_03130 [Anaerolineales bacterium]|nr:hypothetical protein [Anaerolineales bacterium]